MYSSSSNYRYNGRNDNKDVAEGHQEEDERYVDWDSFLRHWPKEQSSSIQQTLLREKQSCGIPAARRPHLYRMIFLHYAHQYYVPSADVRKILNLSHPQMHPFPLIGSREIFVDEILKAYSLVEGESVHYVSGMKYVATALWELLNPQQQLQNFAASVSASNEKRVTENGTQDPFSPSADQDIFSSPERTGRSAASEETAVPRERTWVPQLPFSHVVECFHSLLHNPYHRVRELYISTTGVSFLGCLAVQLYNYVLVFAPCVIQRLAAAEASPVVLDQAPPPSLLPQLQPTSPTKRGQKNSNEKIELSEDDDERGPLLRSPLSGDENPSGESGKEEGEAETEDEPIEDWVDKTPNESSDEEPPTLQGKSFRSLRAKQKKEQAMSDPYENYCGLDSLALIAQRWFCTLFCDIVPLSELEPIWTTFVCFGWKGLLRFSVQLLIDHSYRFIDGVPDGLLIQALIALPSCVVDLAETVQRSWGIAKYFSTSELLEMERAYNYAVLRKSLRA